MASTSFDHDGVSIAGENSAGIETPGQEDGRSSPAPEAHCKISRSPSRDNDAEINFRNLEWW